MPNCRNPRVFLIAVSVCICWVSNLHGQGFNPEAVDAWKAILAESQRRFGWTDQLDVRWDCRPLRVVQKDQVRGRSEEFQLLGDASIHTTYGEDRITKAIYTLDTFNFLTKHKNASDEWVLTQSADHDGTDYWKWSPGPNSSFSGSRTSARMMVELPCFPMRIFKRLDEIIPPESIDLISEDDVTQVYEILPSTEYKNSGKIILSKINDYRPVSIFLTNGSNQSQTTFEYANADGSNFKFMRKQLRLEAGSWNIVDGSVEEYAISIDDQVLPVEFNLKHYGIELERRPTTPYPDWLWFIAAGAFLVGLAVWLRRRNAMS